MAYTYADSGVDVKKVRKIQKNINRIIFEGKKNALIGHYAGIFNIGSEMLAIHTDGVGSKVLVAQELEKYDTIGIDAVAMNVNDVICIGAVPLAGVDYLAMAREDEFLVEEIMKGLRKGADESGIDIVGGETAILPEIIKGGKRPFDLAFTVVGKVEKFITGSSISPGDVLIGIESSGLHSNGYTLARRVLDINSWGEEMLVPTRIYVKPILTLLKECKINGIAHITGGAYSKLTRLGKYKFLLDAMPEPPEIFKALLASVAEEEAYKTFNMGIGMVVAVPPSEEEKVLETLKKENMGAQRIGFVDKGEGVFLVKEGRNIRLDK